MPMPSQRVRRVLMLSSKMNSAARSPRRAAAIANCTASVDLPVPGGADEQRAGALLEAAAQQRVELRRGRSECASASTCARDAPPRRGAETPAGRRARSCSRG